MTASSLVHPEGNILSRVLNFEEFLGFLIGVSLSESHTDLSIYKNEGGGGGGAKEKERKKT